jgi:hypothetical protein
VGVGGVWGWGGCGGGGVAVKDDERQWGGVGVSTTWMMSLIIRLIRMYVMMVYVLFT